MAEISEAISGDASLAAMMADIGSKLENLAEEIKTIDKETKSIRLEVRDLAPVSP